MNDSNIFPPSNVMSFATTSVQNHVVVWANANGRSIQSSGKVVPAGAFVGSTDSQTLTNKTIQFTGSTNWATEASCSIRSNGLSDTTSSAFLTFNRVNYYSTNFGVDNTNTLKWTGLSLGSSIPWSVTTSGVMSIYRSAFFGVGEYNAGNSGSSINLSFSNGQKQRLTLTANATVSMTFPGVGNYLLRVIQDATGNRTLTMGGNVRYMGSATLPEINSAANGETIYSIYWSGNYAYIGGQKVGV